MRPSDLTREQREQMFANHRAAEHLMRRSDMPRPVLPEVFGFPLDWHDIEAEGWQPEDVPQHDGRPCTFCGSPTVWHFVSDDTAPPEALCDQAGFIEVCFDCQAWYRLREENISYVS